MRYLYTTLLILYTVTPAAGQQPASSDRTEAVRVFLDCSSCDETFIRTEITFVNYVRTREDADVHVLITTQGTGGGGVEYALKFIGLDRFKGVDNSLTYTALQTATPDERRRGVASVLKLGLVRYVTDTPLASRLALKFEEPKAQSAGAARARPLELLLARHVVVSFDSC